MQPKQAALHTRRLVLRAIEETDREPMLDLLCDSRISQTYMLPEYADKAQADPLFRRLMALCHDPAHFLYGIYLDQQLIGFINDCGMDEDKIELGYVISPEHWNQGYASEALAAYIRELFRMGFPLVKAGFFTENTASRRVMEKCGMSPLGEETVIPYRGADRLCRYYAICRSAD